MAETGSIGAAVVVVVAEEEEEALGACFRGTFTATALSLLLLLPPWVRLAL